MPVRLISAFFLLFLLFRPGITLDAPGDPPGNKPSRLELIHADISRGMVQNGIPLKLLEGNVHIRQDSLELYCDRAVYDARGKKISLQGHVTLIKGADTLTAATLTYFESQKLAVAERNVQVHRPDQFMRSEYLEYYYQTDRIFARANLLIHDYVNRVSVTGRKGEYLPDRKFSYVQHQAHLWQVDSSGSDTLHIFAHRLSYEFREAPRATALDSVRFWQDALTATCDSAVYLIKKDVVYLEGNPHARYKNNELFGKQMELVLDSLEVKQVHLIGDALAVSVEDSLQKKENRLSGREIIMYISNRQLREVWAISNARSLYYLKEKQQGRGINVASADTIKAFFTRNELDSIAVIGGSQGIYYPENYQGRIAQE